MSQINELCVTSQLNVSMSSEIYVDMTSELNVSVTSQLNKTMTSQLKEFSTAYSYIHGYLALIVCAWGITTNISNITVLTRPKLSSSTNLILTWIALADLLKLIFYLPFCIHFYILRDYGLPFPSTRSEEWIVYCVCFINLSVIWHAASLWLVVSLAVFRYVYIGFPFGGAKHCTLRRAKLAIVAVFVSTIVVCVPNYLTIIYKRVDDDAMNNSTTLNSTSWYYTVPNNPSLLEKFNYYIHALILKFIPCILLTILTILLIVNMHRVKGRRNKLLKSIDDQPIKTDHEYATNRTTAMLLAVVGLSLLHELPHGILTLCNIFNDDFYEDVYAPLGDLLDMMALLSNSVNFILYCSMSQLFNETFKEIFCRPCAKISQNRHMPDQQGVKFEAIQTNSDGMSFPFPDNNS